MPLELDEQATWAIGGAELTVSKWLVEGTRDFALRIWAGWPLPGKTPASLDPAAVYAREGWSPLPAVTFGAPRNLRPALYVYNRSRLYADAVLAYARVMGRDVRAFYGFQAWQVLVRTPNGYRRITGP